jgi:hypothetical protein
VKYIIPLVALALFAGSCQKDNSLNGDANKITITGVQPLQNTTCHFGDTVNLAASIATGSELHSVTFLVKRPSGDTLYSTYKHAHTLSLSLNYQWVDTVTQTTDLQVEISVILGNGHTDSLLIPIHCMP